MFKGQYIITVKKLTVNIFSVQIHEVNTGQRKYKTEDMFSWETWEGEAEKDQEFHSFTSDPLDPSGHISICHLSN